MKLYHYTNLKSLALILKNKTIRFNRLDQVDDLEEGVVESLGIKFGKYVFASCWTESDEESIPLWKMYGGDNGGVRIALEKEMFQEYLVNDLMVDNMKTEGSMWAKIPRQEFMNPEYFVMPIWDYNGNYFYRRVEYVDDVSVYTKNAACYDNIHDNRGCFSIKTRDFGTYKNKRWAFQNETRFVLNIFPENPLLLCHHPELSSIVASALRNNKELPFTYYDLHIKPEVINNIEIMLSPSADEADRLIVEALVEKYVPSATVIPSALGKVVRLK